MDEPLVTICELEEEKKNLSNQIIEYALYRSTLTIDLLMFLTVSSFISNLPLLSEYLYFFSCPIFTSYTKS